MKHPLQILALESIPLLTKDILAALYSTFPKLDVLLLGAGQVAETSPIADQLMARPGTIIGVNRHIYFNSTMRTPEWSRLVERYKLKEDALWGYMSGRKSHVKLIKGWIGVTPHPCGIPIFNSVLTGFSEH